MPIASLQRPDHSLKSTKHFFLSLSKQKWGLKVNNINGFEGWLMKYNNATNSGCMGKEIYTYILWICNIFSEINDKKC